MNLEQIKQEKIKEVEEFYKLIGLYSTKQSLLEQKDLLRLIQMQKDEPQVQHEKEEKLHWTRLSINSNIGCVVE